MKQISKWVPMVAIAVLAGMVYWQQSRGSSSQGRGAIGNSQHYDWVQVLDGDTIKLPDGQSVRFCGIDAPETAKRGKPGQPVGEAAKQKLRSLIDAGGGKVIISPAGSDRYGRIVAEVFVSAKNPQQPEEEKLLNYELVKAGMAYHYRQYSKTCPSGVDILDAAEREAKAKRLGVWAGNYQKPWDFRKAQRSGV